MDQRIDVFAEYSFGKIALQKIASPEANFRLYLAGWIGNANEREVMKVTGAVFREPTRGPNKGQLSIMVPKTQRTAYVTSDEMSACEAEDAARLKEGLGQASKSPADIAGNNIAYVVQERLADHLDREQAEQALQALNGVRQPD